MIRNCSIFAIRKSRSVSHSLGSAASQHLPFEQNSKPSVCLTSLRNENEQCLHDFTTVTSIKLLLAKDLWSELGIGHDAVCRREALVGDTWKKSWGLRSDTGESYRFKFITLRSAINEFGISQEFQRRRRATRKHLAGQSCFPFESASFVALLCGAVCVAIDTSCRQYFISSQMIALHSVIPPLYFEFHFVVGEIIRQKRSTEQSEQKGREEPLQRHGNNANAKNLSPATTSYCRGQGIDPPIFIKNDGESSEYACATSSIYRVFGLKIENLDLESRPGILSVTSRTYSIISTPLHRYYCSNYDHGM